MLLFFSDLGYWRILRICGDKQTDSGSLNLSVSSFKNAFARSTSPLQRDLGLRAENVEVRGSSRFLQRIGPVFAACDT